MHEGDGIEKRLHWVRLFLAGGGFSQSIAFRPNLFNGKFSLVCCGTKAELLILATLNYLVICWRSSPLYRHRFLLDFLGKVQYVKSLRNAP